MKNLNELYEYILDRSNKNLSTTVKDICDHFPNTYRLNSKESNFSNCPTLYKDIDEINGSNEFHKIIVKDNNNFRCGTEEECLEYAKKVKIHALKQLKKYWNIQHKAGKNSQFKYKDDENNAIELVNSFIDEIKPKSYTDEELMTWELEDLRAYCKALGGYYYIQLYDKQQWIDEIREAEKKRDERNK